MADQAITALPKKTYSGSSQIAATDYLLGIDSAEGYQMLIQDLGEYIINRATASLAGSTQTLASAINALNSKIPIPLVTMNTIDTVIQSIPMRSVFPIYCNTDVMVSAFGIEGRTGSGLAIRHSNDITDFVFFDLTVRICRYTLSTGTFSRKGKIDFVDI